MQQTVTSCAFCDDLPGTESGRARTWGQDEWITHSICVDCAIQTESNLDECDYVTCDGCGLVVDALAALTRFRVKLGHLEGSLQPCAHCSSRRLATYRTRNLEEHLVVTAAE
ncbi:DUF7558 family protein [Halorussus ruber]|uniref:DUF7558 family protein n=1 Tax=Halorussus ruber TaxID=1126238 RepID=UPI001092AD3A|nr:hypothetical protein [Halorussus ruber]